MNDRFGPYIMLKRIGCGGMAETWLAARSIAPNVHKYVVLKCILPACNDVPDYVRLFYHEAGIALRLQHPDIIQTWECTLIEGRHVMVMEFLKGVTVDELLVRMRETKQTMPPVAAALIAAKLLDGLQYFHQLEDDDGTPLNLIHRDVNPQNIFVCFDGQCRLFDFGVSRIGSEKDDIQRGMIVGKPAYMSPEQCQNISLDGKSDTFSMAVVLYEMVTGCSLFDRDNEIQTLNAVINDPIIPPKERLPGTPERLSDIIMHELERDPANRYPSDARFASELRTFIKQTGQSNAGTQLVNFLQTCFEERIQSLKLFLAETSHTLNEDAPSLASLVNASKQISDIPASSNIRESISISKISLLTKATAVQSAVPKEAIPDAPLPSEAERIQSSEVSDSPEQPPHTLKLTHAIPAPPQLVPIPKPNLQIPSQPSTVRLPPIQRPANIPAYSPVKPLSQSLPDQSPAAPKTINPAPNPPASPALSSQVLNTRLPPPPAHHQRPAGPNIFGSVPVGPPKKPK